jgi:hypothetical protein
MTVSEWIDEFERAAELAGDRERLRLVRLHPRAYRHRQTDPDRMLDLLEEGRQLARRLREPWWELFYEHWKLETLIYYKDDYRNVVEMGVKATLELRKPGYEGHPLRFGVWCNLVAAYLCVDPRGHADSVRQALDYLATEVPADGEERYLLQARRQWFADEMGDIEQARRLALEELAMCDGDSDRDTAEHHEVNALAMLAWMDYRRGDWVSVARWAEAGEQRSREIAYSYELGQFLLWRAVVARHGGDEGPGRRLFRRGEATLRRLRQSMGELYYDAASAYHELASDFEKSWQVRERELKTTVGKNQIAYEARVRLKRVRLLMRMGRPTDDESGEVRRAASLLRQPEWYLGELERILTGRRSETDVRL